MSNSKVDYTQENLFEFYLNKILLDWIEDHHPEIVAKAKEFLMKELPQ